MAVATRKRRVKRDGSKSAAIREANAANPQAGPSEIIEILKAKGIEVSASFVSNVKSKDKANGGRQGGRVGRPRSNGDTQITMTALLGARDLIDRVGSVAEAHAALKTVDLLRAKPR